MLKIYKFAAAMILSVIGLSMTAPQVCAQTEGEPAEPEVPVDALPDHSPSGTLNVSEFPEGMNMFRINGLYSINRAFKGGVSLYRNGELIRVIPASNAERFNTWEDVGEGASRVDFGYVAIQFWNKTTDPGSQSGEYNVVVPAGLLYTDKDKTVTNPEWKFTVKVVGSSRGSLLITPAGGSSQSRLETFTLTLPNADNFKWNNTQASIYIEEKFGDVANIPCTYVIDGLNCVITAETPITTTGTYYLHIPNGFYLEKVGDTFAAGNSIMYTYYVAPDVSAGVSVSPDNKETWLYIPGKIVSGINRYVLFTLNLPDPVIYTLMEKPKFYAVNEAGIPEGDPVEEFYLVKDPNDSKILYVTTFAFIDPQNEEGGDFLPPEGNYALVMPRNAYYVNVTTKDDNGNDVVTPQPNAQYQFNYTIGVNDKYPVVLYPLSGTKMNNLEFVSVTFDEGNEVTMSGRAYAHISNGIEEYALSGTIVEDLPNEVRFQLPYPLTQAGEWTFTTPAGSFFVNGNSTSVSAVYTIDPTMPVLDRTLTVDPAEGTVESLQVFKVRFKSYPKATEYGQIGGKISLTKDGKDVTIPVKYYSVDDNCLLLDMETPLDAAGTYVLTIASNSISATTEDGYNVLNDQASFRYTIEGPEYVDLPKPAITPADGKMTKNQQFVLTLAEGEVIAEVSGNVRLYPKDNRETSWKYSAAKTAENAVTLTLEDGQAEIVDGDYQLVVPAGLIKTAGSISVEYVYDFVCDESGAVEGIEANDAPADVFNAAGIVVLRNADENALRTLDKGLYIYKGRKIIVK